MGDEKENKAVAACAFACVVLIALGCNDPPSAPITPRGIVVANVLSSGPLGCSGAGAFLWEPECSPTECNGPDTSDDAALTPSGTGDFELACAIIPQADGFAVAVTMQANLPGANPYGPFPVLAKIGGVFPSRASAGGQPIENITAEYVLLTTASTEAETLFQDTCTAAYVYSDNGEPGAPLPPAADTIVDDGGGSIWVSVFCSGATNVNPDISGRDGCGLSATFRLEGCATTP